MCWRRSQSLCPGESKGFPQRLEGLKKRQDTEGFEGEMLLTFKDSDVPAVHHTAFDSYGLERWVLKDSLIEYERRGEIKARSVVGHGRSPIARTHIASLCVLSQLQRKEAKRKSFYAL
ncbi:hypothetical protein ACOMHN_002027 [Nucella lapillus]